LGNWVRLLLEKGKGRNLFHLTPLKASSAEEKKKETGSSASFLLPSGYATTGREGEKGKDKKKEKGRLSPLMSVQ